MANKCLSCSKDTKNPKFCSRSCSATYTNKAFPKRKKKLYHCSQCRTCVPKRRKFCLSCNPNNVDWSLITLEEISSKRSYQKNSRIRELARTYFFKIVPVTQRVCMVCGYSKHIEICHIKPIHTFDKDAKVSEINHISNLACLCPNHHWELDNNLLTLDFSFLARFTQEVSQLGVPFEKAVALSS